MAKKVFPESVLPEIYLCELDDLSEPKSSKGFSLSAESGQWEVVLVRNNDQVHGYRNSCPHTGAPLEWQPDQFLDMTDSFIQCSIHGALFTLESGYCVRGPCAGRSLEPLSVKNTNGKLYLVV